jgi:hypothetical protein
MKIHNNSFNEIRLHDDQFCVRLSQTNDYDETKSIIVDPDSVIELAMRLLEIAGWERTEDAEVDGYIVMFFRKRKGEEND